VKQKIQASRLPTDFAQALKAAGLVTYFGGIPESHRREYLKWISETKKPAIREARVNKALKMLADKSERH
jgi:uncharacterized protein YdeI (YjbR/CyaY-like superfamily)